MFKILGTDGKEYGPVTANVLREWIAQRRAGAATQVQSEGSTEWRRVADFPEFAAALSTSPSSAPPPLPAPLAGSGSATTPKTSGLAVASLVLGLVGFCGITAIVGLVLGIVAKVKIRRSGGRLKGGGLAIAGICLSLAMLLAIPIIAGFLLPALAKAQREGPPIDCEQNIKQISLALRLYADENDQQYPPAVNWCDAILRNLAGPEVFRCPRQRGLQSAYGFNETIAGRKLSSISGDTVMLFEASSGWNVSGGPDQLAASPPHGRTYFFGFADGTVRKVSVEDLPALRWEP
jgi:hypothetical protein